MKKVIVSSDSTADLGYLFEELNIPVLPLEVLLGDRVGLDGAEIKPEDIYEYYNRTKTTPKTSAITPERYLEFFRQFTEQGYEVVHFVISSEMSSCYNNACIAASELEGVYVIDSRNLSTGMGLQVLYADGLAKSGVPAAEIAEKVRARQDAVQASFVVDTMEFLYRGGRCSGVAAFFAGILKIRPCIRLKGGKMIVGKKYMFSTSRSILKYVDETLAAYSNPDVRYMFVTHTSAPDDLVAEVKAKLRAAYPEANILETIAGATVTSHCGKGTLGILYFNDGGAQD